MVGAGAGDSVAGDSMDRLQQLKVFDESKAGVKGLVDSGVTRIPPIFVIPPEDISGDETSSGELTQTQFTIPVVDLGDISSRRPDAVAEVRQAAEMVGFFQVVNHGIPGRVMEMMLEGARKFHELPREVKAEYYTRELTKNVKFMSNFDLYESKSANWRDTLFCVMGPEPLDPHDLPFVCRDITMEYSEEVRKLGITLFELLSEALGLKPDHLIGMDCAKGHVILTNYYPPCPEPELTMGTTKHSDPDFLTLLLQDHIGGLQIQYQNQWIDVPPAPGALVVNIGDLLQLISNDRFKSVEHRAVAKNVGPRVSIACFFTLHLYQSTMLYGPIKELLSEDQPPVYKETSIIDFITYYDGKGLDGKSALTHFKLQRFHAERIFKVDVEDLAYTMEVEVNEKIDAYTFGVVALDILSDLVVAAYGLLPCRPVGGLLPFSPGGGLLPWCPGGGLFTGGFIGGAGRLFTGAASGVVDALFIRQKIRRNRNEPGESGALSHDEKKFTKIGSLLKILGDKGKALEFEWAKWVNVIKDHISDFGSARTCDPESSNWTSFAGTFGYSAPGELAYTMEVHEKINIIAREL
ncbi:hypothetical protein FNV43_RR01458 [Rhamnella rubrinervis]|uniref:Fe2OG dioxygenase domain-containing protein n=1 Tax=Rhamnella rubrinervis TaxID=2594499 RepID=A0A8K0HQZ8_9ROSA|nr:hypothetical protein FNV43_RR01458 [Rhamnella rubrinervis]